MGRLFWIVIILILNFSITVAQQKTIEHLIVKGESVYVISRKYGVTMNDIFRLNPGSEDIIYAGEILLVPDVSKPSPNITSGDYISNYEVSYGETKFGLSRRFGVSIRSLEQQNPHIVRMLQAGHIINVDKNYVVKPEDKITKKGEHFVNKGETLWGLARQYSISVNELIAANSDRLSGVLKAGQTLIIPEKNTEFTTSGLYIVKRGDTKYQLAKRFNTTIEELERNNPQIVEMLQAGHRINVMPSDDTTLNASNDVALNINDTSSVDERTLNEVDDNTTENSGDEKKYIDYTIQPKETLYSLSRRAGMTIADLTELNPELKESVRSGAVIKMPADMDDTGTTTTAVTTSTTSNPETRSNALLEKNDNTELVTNLNTEQTNGIYFYLPFTEAEFENNEMKLDSFKLDKGQRQKYYDFYKGAQIAMDSAKALGLNFNVKIVRKDSLNPLSNEIIPDASNVKNAILIPFLEASEEQPNINAEENTAIVSFGSNLEHKKNGFVYEALPSIEAQKSKILNYLKSQNANVIVISDLEKARNKDLITAIIPDAKFLKVDRSGTLEDQELDTLLDSSKLNYVILDSNKIFVYLNSTNALLRKLSDYNIQLAVLEISLIPRSAISERRFRILKMIYPSILPIGKNASISRFEDTYQNRFNTSPSKNVIFGFDTTLDALLRLSQNSTFKATAKTTKSQHINLKFEYVETSDNTFENNGIYIMQYGSGDGVIEIE